VDRLPCGRSRGEEYKFKLAAPVVDIQLEVWRVYDADIDYRGRFISAFIRALKPNRACCDQAAVDNVIFACRAQRRTFRKWPPRSSTRLPIPSAHAPSPRARSRRNAVHPVVVESNWSRLKRVAGIDVAGIARRITPELAQNARLLCDDGMRRSVSRRAGLEVSDWALPDPKDRPLAKSGRSATTSVRGCCAW